MNGINVNNLYASEMYKTYTSLNQETKIKNQVNKDSKLYKACQDFESIFIKQMLNVMRKTINKSGLIDGGFAEEVFEDMLYDEYAQKMSENAHFGLSDSLYKQLARYSDI